MSKKIMVLFATLLMICISTTALANANTAEIDGEHYVAVNTIWDVDFNDSTILNSAPSFIFADADGKQYRHGADYLGAHSGSVNSTITLDENVNAVNRDNGVSVRMVSANSADQVQWNNLLTSTVGTEKIFVYEFDFCATSFDAATTITPLYYKDSPTVANRVWMNALTITVNKTATFGGGSISLSENTWYTFKIYNDLTGRKQLCYVDDQFIGEASISSTDKIYGMHKLSMSTRGAPCEVWYDNIKAYELEKLPSIVDATASENYIDVTFSEAIDAEYFISEGKVSNFSALFGETAVIFNNCENAAQENTVRFFSELTIPTGVKLTLNFTYKGATIFADMETSPADTDVYSVYISENDGYYSAECMCNNVNNENKNIIMIISLINDKNQVVAVGCSGETALVNGGMIFASAYSDEAVSAEVFFLTDWTGVKPFKDVIYLSK